MHAERLGQRTLLDQKAVSSQPWLEDFQFPCYYGDIVYQEIVTQNQLEMIPNDYRIALPSQQIATNWTMSNR